MVVKPSRLRANLYRLLDHVLRTGEPIEIDRGGKKLLIVPKEKQAKLNNLLRRDVIVGDPEDLVHLDWSKECNKSGPEIHLIDSSWLKRLHGAPD